jgi:hypothetical protein
MAATLRVRLPARVPDAIRELVVRGPTATERHLLADVRLLDGVTLVVSPRRRSGAAHVQNVTPNADVLRGTTAA